MKILILALPLLAAISLQAPLPTASSKAAGFDPARIEVRHATTKRFVDEGKHAGLITLLARHGKIVDFQTYGLRDIEKQLPMERDAICRLYSMSKIITCVGALVLFEEGRFNPDDPVANYLSECQIDPKEQIVAIALAQPFPFNEHNFFARFQTAYHQALK